MPVKLSVKGLKKKGMEIDNTNLYLRRAFETYSRLIISFALWVGRLTAAVQVGMKLYRYL
jgi:hypothetical protein